VAFSLKNLMFPVFLACEERHNSTVMEITAS